MARRKNADRRHRRASRALAGAIVASTSLAAGPLAHAQESRPESAPAGPSTLQDVVVTAIRQQFQAETATSATGFQLDVVDTPVSLSVLTKDMIDVTGARTIEEYAHYVPNVSKYQDFGGSTAKYQARGFRIDALRGLKVNGVSFFNTQIDSYFTERVEFVRGPTSIVYGNNGFGGIINTITKRPQPERAVTVGVEGGSWSRYRGDLDVNLPLGERFAARLITGYDEGGEFVDGIERDLRFVAPSLSVQLGERTSLLLTGAAQRRESVPTDQYTSFLDADGNEYVNDGLSRSKFIGVDWATQDVSLDFVQAQLAHATENGMTLRLNYGFSGAQFDTEYAFAYGPAAPNGDAALYGFKTNEGVDLHVVEASVGGEFEAFGRDNEFLLSAEYYDQKLAIDNFSSFGFDTINLYEPRSDFAPVDFGPPSDLTRVTQRNTALSGQVLFRPLERLSVLAGARYDDGNTIDTGSSTPPERRDNKYDALTTRLGLSVELTPQLNVYANFSEGFQPIGSAARTVNDEVPDPEEGTQYEAGFKGKLLNGTTTWSLAYFDITRENIREAVRGQPGRVQLTGEQKHKGMEFEFVGEPVKGLNIIGYYAYLKTEITKNALQPALIGNEQGNVPKNSATLYVSYAPQSGPLAGFAFAGGVRYSGERWVTTDNTLKLPSHTVTDLSVMYRVNRKLNVRVTLNNVFDEYYWEPYYNNSAYGLAHGTPRELGARISYTF